MLNKGTQINSAVIGIQGGISEHTPLGKDADAVLQKLLKFILTERTPAFLRSTGRVSEGRSSSLLVAAETGLRRGAQSDASFRAALAGKKDHREATGPFLV